MTRELTQKDFQGWAKEFPEADIYYNSKFSDKASALSFTGVLEDYYLSKNGLFSLKEIIREWVESKPPRLRKLKPSIGQSWEESSEDQPAFVHYGEEGYEDAIPFDEELGESKEQPKKWEELESGEALVLVEGLDKSFFLNPQSLLFYERFEGKAVKIRSLYDVPNMPRIITLEGCHEDQHFTQSMFKEFQEQPTPEKPQSIYTQEYIDNTSHFMCEEPLKGWGWDFDAEFANSCELLSKDSRVSDPYHVLWERGSHLFKNFSLTNPNKPKEQDTMEPFVKLSEEQQDYFLKVRFRLIKCETDKSALLEDISSTGMTPKYDVEYSLLEAFEFLEYYSPEEKAWVPFGEKVES